jgi:hypothetical protein
MSQDKIEDKELVEDEANKSEKMANSLTEKMELLICCFCAQEYLFEFTMKHHLLQEHKRELQALDNWPTNLHYCDYCKAGFYYKSLVPKHIAFSHSKKLLDEYFSRDNNLQRFQIDKENLDEPSFKLLDCSPGLNELFDDFTCDSVKKFRRNDNSVTATPKSILKKTPFSGKIVILSPESAALRRTINNLKRSASARRELRFDLPPLQPSPEGRDFVPLPPLNFNTPPKKKKFWHFLSRRSPPPINGKIKRKIREKACKLSNRSIINHMVTSTPRGCDMFDSSELECEELDNSISGNWNTATKSSDFKPLFLSAERYQCNICREKFDSNCELLTHQKLKHKWISFKPAFRCGSCGSKFFRNSLLVRHCHYQHASHGRSWN